MKFYSSSPGDAAPAALWATAIMTGVAVLMAGIVASGREYARERALVDEANILIAAVRAYQADNAAPISEYLAASEVGWPGTAPADLTTTPPTVADNDCGDALSVLAGTGGNPSYISTAYQTSSQSLAFPSLRWVTSCDGAGGQQFRLRLTSFRQSNDPRVGAICTTTDEPLTAQTTSTACPPLPVAQNVAAGSSGTVRDEADDGPRQDFVDTTVGVNAYVDWTVWRGAAYPALNRLSELLLWRNFNNATGFGVERPTTAFSGIRLGGWEDAGVTYWSATPPDLARFIGGVQDTNADGVFDASDANLTPLVTPTATNIDARSFAMFYRAARHDPFDVPTPPTTPLFQLAAGSCLAGAPPTWLSMVESVRIAFRGFDNTDQPTISLAAAPAAPLVPQDRVTLMPTSWQAYDSGGALQYNPEVVVELLTVLPGFLNTATTPTSYCLPMVVHGRVDSADVSDPLEVFAPADTDTVVAGVQVVRTCNFTDGTGPAPDFPQTLPNIPRAEIAEFRPTTDAADAVQAVRLSAAGYCPMPGAPGDV